MKSLLVILALSVGLIGCDDGGSDKGSRQTGHSSYFKVASADADASDQSIYGLWDLGTVDQADGSVDLRMQIAPPGNKLELISRCRFFNGTTSYSKAVADIKIDFTNGDDTGLGEITFVTHREAQSDATGDGVRVRCKTATRILPDFEFLVADDQGQGDIIVIINNTMKADKISDL